MQLLYLLPQSSRLQSATETGPQPAAAPPGPLELRVTHSLNRCLMSVFNLLGYYSPAMAASPGKPDTTVSGELTGASVQESCRRTTENKLRRSFLSFLSHL